MRSGLAGLRPGGGAGGSTLLRKVRLTLAAPSYSKKSGQKKNVGKN